MVHPFRTFLYELWWSLCGGRFNDPLAMPAGVCALGANRVVLAHSRALSHAPGWRGEIRNQRHHPCVGFLASSTLKLCPPRMKWFTDKSHLARPLRFGIRTNANPQELPLSASFTRDTL